MIPYGKQNISQADIKAVEDVLRSDRITQGAEVPAFERAVADYCGAGYAVAVNSGTSALHIACLALDLGPGDTLWTSTNSFVASANCARYCGADVDFVDIDPRTYNMSPDALEEKLKAARKSGKLPKVVVPVHFAGQSSAMKRISKLAGEYGFSVIEDGSHAIGGSYLGESIGGCRYSDITVFSFHPVKIITTGEGGMALTKSQDLFERMNRYRSHCVTRDIEDMCDESEGGWYYEQIGLGFNYRMTDIQAALGRSQMGRLDEFVTRRSALACRYDQLLGGLPLEVPFQHPDTASSWHLYVVRLKGGSGVKTRKQVYDTLIESGIGVNVHYIPIHLQPYYRQMGFSPGDFPEAESYYREALTLPLFYDLTEKDQDKVVRELKRAVR